MATDAISKLSIREKCGILHKMEYMIERNKYLKMLIASKENGFPKVVTGIRRCGKSYLLNKIYKKYLIDNGVPDSNIIEMDLTKVSNAYYRDPLFLYDHIIEITKNNIGMNYVILDEIQEVYSIINTALTDGKHIKAKPTDDEVISFVDVILDLASMSNIDLYVTGSNLKMLSTDIVTEFRDKATNIMLQPLSFEEFSNFKNKDENTSLMEYLMYGGMPLAVIKPEAEKEKYLKELF